jgi:hypothetical protein
VTVTIPALQSSSPGGPAYTVTGGTLQLNGVPPSGVSTSNGLIILAFSQPVVGLGLVTSTQGRFGDTFTLMTDLPGAGLTGFVNSASNFSNYFEQAAGLPLQMTTRRVRQVIVDNCEFALVVKLRDDSLSNFVHDVLMSSRAVGCGDAPINVPGVSQLRGAAQMMSRIMSATMG